MSRRYHRRKPYANLVRRAEAEQQRLIREYLASYVPTTWATVTPWPKRTRPLVIFPGPVDWSILERKSA